MVIIIFIINNVVIFIIVLCLFYLKAYKVYFTIHIALNGILLNDKIFTKYILPFSFSLLFLAAFLLLSFMVKTNLSNTNLKIKKKDGKITNDKQNQLEDRQKPKKSLKQDSLRLS